ncbi:MAG: tetratricopeptide repeat protein [Acidobacteria bacterium]|nr:tetratricopeptide repeat protein [Acidobacteriota bacterium]
MQQYPVLFIKLATIIQSAISCLTLWVLIAAQWGSLYCFGNQRYAHHGFSAVASESARQHGKAALVNVGDRIRVNVTAGFERSYLINADPGSVLMLGVIKTGAPLRISFQSSGGQAIGARWLLEDGRASLSFIADSLGGYVIVIQSLAHGQFDSEFNLSVDEIRPASAVDRILLNAEDAYHRGLELMSHASTESLIAAGQEMSVALRSYRKAGNTTGISQALQQLAEIHGLLDRKQDALSCFREALQTSRVLAGHEELVKALCRLGRFLAMVGRVSEARDLLDEALDLSRKRQDKDLEGLSLLRLGQAHYHIGNTGVAMDLYQRALEVFPLGSSRRAEALLEFGLALYDRGRIGEAQRRLEEGMALYSSLDDRRGTVQALIGLGRTHRAGGENQQRLEYCRKAEELLAGIADSTGKGMLYNSYAIVYSDLGDSQTALDYYLRSLEWYRKAGIEKAIAGTLYQIGAIHRSREDLQTALSYFERARAITKEIGDRRLESNIIRGIGGLHQASGDDDMALEFYSQALSLADADQDPFSGSATHCEIGRLYEDAQAWDNAHEQYESALTLQRFMGDRVKEASTLCRIAEMERRLGRTESAKSSLEESIRLVENVRDRIDVPGLKVSLMTTAHSAFQRLTDLLMQSPSDMPARTAHSVHSRSTREPGLAACSTCLPNRDTRFARTPIRRSWRRKRGCGIPWVKDISDCWKCGSAGRRERT